MDKILTEKVKQLINELIYSISGFTCENEHFETIRDFAYAHVTSPDYFINYDKTDALGVVHNLCDKFRFHAFPVQANYLTDLAEKFLNKTTSDELEFRVNFLVFLLKISRSPVKYYVEDVRRFQPLPETTEKIVNWGDYLNNCKVMLKSNYVETSDEDWSEFSESEPEQTPIKTPQTPPRKKARKPDKPPNRYNILEGALLAREELKNSIQFNWWSTSTVKVLPSSNAGESQIALKWDEYVSEMALGLIVQKTNIVPEYRIIRELIWEFYAPYTCFSFGFEGGKVCPKTGVAIGSIRPQTLHYFLYEFIPYIEDLRVFRGFHNSLLGDYFVTSIPDTYRSYWEALEELLFPVYGKIQEMEDNIRRQDEITTVLKVARSLKPIFKNLQILKRLHVEISLNYNVENTFESTTFLLSRLSFDLLNSSNLVEQNIYLTVYLKSLYKYFTIIEIWLEEDFLDDQSDEFIITRKKSRFSQDFKLKPLDTFSANDGMLQLMQKKVVQLAKNIHLLRLLGKLYLVSEQMDKFEGTLHQEFTEKVLHEAENYSDSEKSDPELHNLKSESCENSASIESFLELSDGFLATIFQPFLFRDAGKNTEKPESLYEKINSKITAMFPAKQILEKTFLDVLNTRYSIPGLLVKDILLEQFQLMKYFNLLKHLYLFDEDIIFPFYKNIFKQFENSGAWGNFFWLTSQLQDLLMDLFPDIYEKCRVDVDPTWQQCTNPIAACDLITLHVRFDWPISLIFKQEHKSMYNKIFQFLFKVKWALNTLNHLAFSDLESKFRPFKLQPKLIQERIRKLQAMRFVLLNDLSSIQHYILGHLLSVLWTKFRENFEKSYDLESIIKCHDIFIKRIYTFCMKLKHEKSETYGFKKILNLVLQLQIMWKDYVKIDDKVLHKCEIDYRKCHKFLRPIIDIEVVTY